MHIYKNKSKERMGHREGATFGMSFRTPLPAHPQKENSGSSFLERKV